MIPDPAIETVVRALQRAFDRRRFFCGFWCGWSLAICFNTAVALIFF